MLIEGSHERSEDNITPKSQYRLATLVIEEVLMV